mgnify:CR=1 FL=1
MDASCKIQRSIHDVRLTYKYVSRILGTYHVDSDFSCIVLTVYKLTRNDFHSSTADVVHPLHPQHLIFRFEGFRNALFFGKLLYQPRKHCFCLLVEVCKVSLSSSALSNGSSNIMASSLWNCDDISSSYP